ncbi:hypothetical protein SAMN02787142_3261 [Burkholderia sp. WP9]|uniref:hypothetical protein n=1 Tax=Burkholderia sp. WP9 TaxID=1500263 RepID=UPI00089D195C|nr:hypothetical protein [Burkholderia sp. WP9]SED48954.1 hypothetical protein SAMN02787142_3261 [Burkholderia sp. WP9]
MNNNRQLQDAYRTFRLQTLEQCGSEADNDTSLYNLVQEDVHPSRVLRGRISRFRRHLAFYGTEMLQNAPQFEPHLRRALGIPPRLDITTGKWAIARQYGLLFCPMIIAMRRARALLGRVRSYEGREFIFKLFIERSLPGHFYYTPSLDFSLRHLRLPRSFEELKKINYLNIGWTKAAHHVGLRSPVEIAQLIEGQASRLSGAFVYMLAEERVIRSKEEFDWVPERDRYNDRRTPDAKELREARRIVRILLEYDVDRRLVAGLFRFFINRCSPDGLKETLAALRDGGVDDLSAVFAALPEPVLFASVGRWRFLIDTFDVRSAKGLAQFHRLLESERPISEPLARALLALGATPLELVACQSLLLAVNDQESENPPISELKLLAGAPYRLGIEQIAEARHYLRKPSELREFLAVLERHGYTEPQAVLAFQPCYGAVRPRALCKLLAIVGSRRNGHPPEVVAEWVRQAADRGYIESYEYLVSALEMPNIAHLNQSLKLSPIGPAILRYLVEDRGLRTLKAIRDWYYRDAAGIHSVRMWGSPDVVDKTLLDDAFERKNFNVLEGNRQCVGEAIGRRISPSMGPFPFEADEATKELYRSTKDELQRRERETLAPMLPSILGKMQGILVGSILDYAWGPAEAIDTQLALLNPLLDELKNGAGPSGPDLSPMEAEAIALVYRTTVREINTNWLKLIGRQSDIAHLNPTTRYPMVWKGAQRRLTKSLDRRGLFALAKAARFATDFNTGLATDMSTACMHLSPKRLGDPAADVWSLARHLGVLLAVARKDSVVAPWVDGGFEAIAKIDEEGSEAYQQIEELCTFFDAALGDGLDAQSKKFLSSLGDVEAASLASRLGANWHEDSLTARADIQEAFALCRQRVVEIYSKWAQKEKKKFALEDADGRCTRLMAIVSKSPAAFFAKDAAKLCTRGNIEMWQEARHAHLVVFDESDKRIAGMALLYFEVVPTLHRSIPTLIIRAINPMEDGIAHHTATSIVDAFFDVAIRIAEVSGLAAVAFPSDGGMHLLSNHRDIEGDIKSRYVSPSVYMSGKPIAADMAGSVASWRKRPKRLNVSFDAYERGRSRVGEIYAIWHAGFSKASSPRNAVSEIDSSPASLYD